MNQVELCHWLLTEPTGNYRSVFAPPGDGLDGYLRVGPAHASQHFVLPMVYACAPKAIQDFLPAQLGVRFSLWRDDEAASASAFVGMDSLKVASLLSELSCAIAEWVSELGCTFVAMRICDADGSLELVFCGEAKKQRTITLLHAGICMMAYARGLKCKEWKVLA